MTKAMQSCSTYTYIYREKVLCNFVLNIKFFIIVYLTFTTINLSLVIIYKSLLINFLSRVYQVYRPAPEACD